MNSQDLLSADTSLSAITLKVADLDAMSKFYREGVGLGVIGHTGDSVMLGSGDVPLIVLEYSPLLKHAPASAAGLFHTALLYPSQEDLAGVLFSLAQKYPGSFTGSSDHLVSEALYFDDPEGNGVELYWDRPRSTWGWVEGRVKMDSIFLDPNEFLRTHLTETAASAPSADGVTLGHVHLKVGDIPTAQAFYAGALGFEVMAEYGTQALFVAAGGYHHHIGMNTWQSRGAHDRSPALGLGEVSIVLPTADDLGALRERLTTRGVSVRENGLTMKFDDPWKNEIAVTVAG